MRGCSGHGPVQKVINLDREENLFIFPFFGKITEQMNA